MPDKTTKTNRKPGHSRHIHADIADIAAPITDRRKLGQLRDWINELHEQFDYRQIAALTWRGEKHFGYLQRLAKGDHLTQPPQIRPIGLDWHDLNKLRAVLRIVGEDKDSLRSSCLAILQKSAELNGEAMNLLRRVTK